MPAMKRVVDTSITPDDPAFSEDLIAWQKQHGRHQLPWQQTRDAYRIWLSEIMLQQTQVTTVIPYYHRFLQQFPDVRALAAAPVDQVMSLWAGLGYYTRARNLHRCAQAIVQQHGGVFPADVKSLSALPGIGLSTAAAIAAFAYGTRAAILDGNVKRVLCRVFGVEGFPGQLAVERQLWQLAASLLPEGDIEAYTQGLMDLGATVCTRTRPRCEACPMRARCVAHETSRTSELPMRRPKKATPEKRSVMLWVTYEDELLLEQRPPLGIWGGLQSLPELERLGGNPELADRLAEAGAALADIGEIAELSVLPEFLHAFTHFRLRVTPLKITLARRYWVAAQDSYHWRAINTLESAALPAPVRKLLEG
jgi:A/G-specific adenine glycosylase